MRETNPLPPNIEKTSPHIVKYGKFLLKYKALTMIVFKFKL